MAIYTASIAILWQLLLLVHITLAQNVATITQSNHENAATNTIFPPFSASSSSRPGGATPTAHDNAPGGNNNDNDSNKSVSTSHLVNYYFVFLALLLCCVALAIFFMFRRRAKKLARRRMGSDRESALQRDLSAREVRGAISRWDAAREQRRYWQGRWRSVDGSQEEGLNEHGEAPPPYVPKRNEEGGRQGGDELAVPLQTLSRDDVGLKPPDYSETHATEVDATVRSSPARNSTASGGSSRLP